MILIKKRRMKEMSIIMDYPMKFQVNWWFIKRTTMKKSMKTKNTTTKKRKLYPPKAKEGYTN